MKRHHWLSRHTGLVDSYTISYSGMLAEPNDVLIRTKDVLARWTVPPLCVFALFEIAYVDASKFLSFSHWSGPNTRPNSKFVLSYSTVPSAY